ncbi:MAG: SIR2 family protein, partial [Acidobacteriota bacterium]
RDQVFLPSGGELAGFLAGRVVPNPSGDLLKVAQVIETRLGTGRLYQELQQLFRRDYPPTSLHRFLAALVSRPAPKACEPARPYPLVVTTNYDDLMEKALGGNQFDLIFYVPFSTGDPARLRTGSEVGFYHQAPDGEPRKIDPDNKDAPWIHLFEQRPVILKIHGAVQKGPQAGRGPEEEDIREALEGFVISEDHYIDYLARQPLETQLPPSVMRRLRRTHLLFLGYSLADWNLRAFLHMIHQDPRSKFSGYAVLLKADAYEAKFWSDKGIQLYPVPLCNYVAQLEAALQAAGSETKDEGPATAAGSPS